MCDLAMVLVSLSILQHGAVMVFLLLSVGSLEVDLVCWCNLLKINKSTTATTTTTTNNNNYYYYYYYYYCYYY